MHTQNEGKAWEFIYEETNIYGGMHIVDTLIFVHIYRWLVYKTQT